jgi:hypothetical protein
MALVRRCNICHKKVPHGQLCECEIKAKKDSYKEYKKLRQDKDRQRFYGSKIWIKCRNERATDLLGIDWLEYYRTGKIVVDKLIMHHIIPLEESYELGLDKDNLILLTDSNHKKVHNAYSKGKKDKEHMQRILREVLIKYEKEFL